MIPRSASGPQTILSAITLVLLGVLSCIWSQTGPLLSFLSFSRLHPTVNGSCTSSVVQLAQLAPSKPYVLCRVSTAVRCALGVRGPVKRSRHLAACIQHVASFTELSCSLEALRYSPLSLQCICRSHCTVGPQQLGLPQHDRSAWTVWSCRLRRNLSPCLQTASRATACSEPAACSPLS